MPTDRLDNPTHKRMDGRGCAALLSLAREDLSQQKAESLASEIANISEAYPSIASSAVRLAGRSQTQRPHVDRFLSRLYVCLPRSQHNIRSLLIEMLNASVVRRTGGLNDQIKATRLSMPKSIIDLLGDRDARDGS